MNKKENNNCNVDYQNKTGTVIPINKGRCKLVVHYKKDSTNSNITECKEENIKIKNGETVSLVDLKSKDIKQCPSFKDCLMNLISIEDPFIIIFKLEKNKFQFENFLKSQPTIKDIFAIFSIFKRLYSSTYNKHLYAVLSRTLILDFIIHLEDRIEKMNEHYLVEKAEQTEEFMDSITTYIETVIEYVPKNLMQNFKSLISVIEECLDKVIDVAYKLEKDWSFLKIVNYRIQFIDATLEEKMVNKMSEVVPFSIYPINFMIPGIIQKNIICGPYKNVQHYVDVHCRLLKEDFEESLRCGIRLYKEQNRNNSISKLKNSDIFVNKNVTVSISQSPRRNGHIIWFGDLSTFSGMNWETSKRFMHGSLVVLSNDNFNRYYLALVRNRIPLEKGGKFIQVCFIGAIPSFSKKLTYVLVEPSNFFEPYYQVMTALKNIPVNSFPMYKYLISAETSSKLPAYINSETVYTIDGKRIKICNINDWPKPETLKLNLSQMQAVRTALTSEFSLIQGPPGTGKTYVCLKIIEILLKNVDFRCGSNLGPILVVCYRNHALDQILGGLLKLNIKLLRLGGQSQIDELKLKYNIKSLNRKKISGIRSLLRALRELNKSMESIQREIIKYYNVMSLIEERAGIVLLSVLKKVLSPDHYNKLSKNYLNWMLDDIPKNININKIITLCNKIMKGINKGDLALVKKPPIPENAVYFDKLKICDTFKELPISTNIAPDSMYIITLYDLECTMKFLRESIYLKCTNNLEIDQISDMLDEVNTFNECFTVYSKLKLKLKSNIISHSVNLNLIGDLDLLSSNKKWDLYSYWLQQLIISYQKRVTALQKEHDQKKVLFEELNDMKKVKKIQKFGAQVIGATTTCAARSQRLLAELKPRIVVIEEAAEVLEAHAVASFSSSCQHVILIGDHKQLRPNPSSYRLASDFHLDVSLFERMINNKLAASTLTTQHRMRPEICSIITPSIYEKLDNHFTVYDFPNVIGIKKSIYFINHNQAEEPMMNNYSMSKMNKHEGSMLLNLGFYLVQQGYAPEEITILATYKAQMEFMLSERKIKGFPEGTQITVVDNFQGEENRIILLSLVRCNEDSNIGFLSVENRVCVALSRAKEGLFIIGNMPTLIAKSKLWTEINEVLINNDCIGTSLPLVCKIHCNTTMVSSEEDLSLVIKQGCGKVCNLIMSCKHICNNLCHAIDVEHKSEFRCKEPCKKKCKNQHPCNAYCGDQCPRCQELIDFELDCGHTVEVPCHQITTARNTKKESEIDEFINIFQSFSLMDAEDDSYSDDSVLSLPTCKEPCNTYLKCGHLCTKICHIDDDPEHDEFQCEHECSLKNPTCPFGHRCTKRCHEACGPCTFPVSRKLLCNHLIIKECYVALDEEEECTQVCNKKLNCGHSCKSRCGDPCGKCEQMIEKVIKECGHKVWSKCCELISQKNCTKICGKKLACGHICKRNCNVKCERVICDEPVPTTSILCGHKLMVPCHVKQLKGELNWKNIFSTECNKPCNAKLACGHICTGTCGDCVQGRLHKKCTRQCSLKLLCGHRCMSKCTDDEHLCNQPCSNKCRHGKCRARCSFPCQTKCSIKCNRKCVHFRCEKKCWEPCNKKCLEACPLKLPCGHPCRGYCGYKCPPICSECSKLPSYDDLTKRYIVLEDCGHVISVNHLEEDGSSLRDNHIEMSVCQICKVPIMRTLFYKERKEKTLQHLSDIKKSLILTNNYSDIKDTFSIKLHRLQKETAITKVHPDLIDIVQWIKKSALPFILSANTKLSTTNIRSLLFITDYIILLIEQLKKIDLKLLPKIEGKVLRSRINLLAIKLKESALGLSIEQMNQFTLELTKFKSIIDKYNIIIDQNRKEPKLNSFSKVKSLLNYHDDLADSIFAFSELTIDKDIKIRKYNLEKSKAVSYQAYIKFDIPNVLGDKTMHYGDWVLCDRGHTYYAKIMLNCPNCTRDNECRTISDT